MGKMEAGLMEKMKDFTAEFYDELSQNFLKYFFRMLAAVRSTPPKIGKMPSLIAEIPPHFPKFPAKKK